MSFIKDYPCRHCGANLYLVGYHEIHYGGIVCIYHYHTDGHHHQLEESEFQDGYIECGNCFNKIDIDYYEFMFMVEQEWD